jgi:hypothetical protein
MAMKPTESDGSTEFSKTLRFDFPRIPIIGMLLLFFLLLNYPNLLVHLEDDKGKYSIGTITVIVLALGTAGITLAQLISLSTLDSILPLKKRMLEQGENVRTSYDWLDHVQSQAKPIERAADRQGVHDIGKRVSIHKMTAKQRHATLHALEMECRKSNPAFGVQLEYYYSTYLVFFCTGLFCIFLLTFAVYRSANGISIPAWPILATNTIVAAAAFAGTIATRRMAEYLRVLMLNHDRKSTLRLLSSWFQCRIE